MKVYPEITREMEKFISKQHIFFVGSAPLDPEGHINLSPKGLDTFCILSSHRVAYLDLVGSGNETSAHLLENGRITLMFCAFEGPPNILRLYGKGLTILPEQPEWTELSLNYQLRDYTGARQIIVVDIDRVQTSCGFGVPRYDYKGDRDFHYKCVEKRGASGVAAYCQEHNLESIDHLPTPMGLRQEVTHR